MQFLSRIFSGWRDTTHSSFQSCRGGSTLNDPLYFRLVGSLSVFSWDVSVVLISATKKNLLLTEITILTVSATNGY